MSAGQQAPIAVTGGGGFVGRRFVAEAEAAGWRLRLLSRPQFDLLGREPIAPGLLEGCIAAVHLAAYIPANQADPAEAETCWRANALGTLRLIEAMKAAGVGRLVQTSSANAYAPDVQKPDEQCRLFPALRAPYYLSSKMAQEVFAHHAAVRDRLAVTTLRLSSVYGPGQQGGPVTAFARSLLGGRPVVLANAGRFGADFVAVGDVARALKLFLENERAGIFNIGSGLRSTMAEVAAQLAGLTGAAPGLIEAQDALDAADIGFPALDIGKAKACGYRPTPLAEGLSELVAWLREEGC